jgi:hypothetical protein
MVVGLELVRLQTKLEPPLRNLRSGGGAIAISTIADVTLYGRDVLGHDVSVSGSLSIVFADWTGPERLRRSAAMRTPPSTPTCWKH